jgi:16S rRNA A1518/A1519 N6-dimethyltransferase RsmA/KsgA/DIM1 with predicted DNA glycosylase/AP lyase activity
MRRKKLSTNIETQFISKNEIEKILENNGFKSTARAEELTIQEFETLFNILNK